MRRFTHTICAVVALLTAFGTSAMVLSPSEALQRARSANVSRAMKVAPAIENAVPEVPVFTVNATDGQAALYVFTNEVANTKSTSGSSDGTGFVILSADTCVPATLGYSDTGTFDPANIPPSMKYWLDEYARQIAYARQNSSENSQGDDASAMTSEITAKFTPIEPMCSTTWNQGSPYNMLTPTVNGVHSVTGCVATAMAQIMKYHEYPQKGQGTHSYNWNDSTLTYNFSDVTFDWADMLDSYTSSATDTQKEAVANLMLACGMVSNMNYSPTSSGASTYTAAKNMITYFNYDKNLFYAERQYFPLDEWEEFIYNQLRDNGPVQYSGYNDEGGHSFVCDGYSYNGYFHINWGWGGMSDGYFLLSALDPESQGIGGSTAGYNTMQDVIANVHAPVEGSVYYPVMLMPSGFSISQSSVQLGEDITVKKGVFCSAFGAVSGNLGMKCVSTTNPSTVYYFDGSSFNNMSNGYGLSLFNVTIPEDIPDGTYEISPVVRSSNSFDYVNCMMPMTVVRNYTMTVADGTATFTAGQAAEVSVDSLTFDTPFYRGVKFKVSALASNNSNSEYFGMLTGVIFNTSYQKVAYGASYSVDLEPGETMPIEYISTFSHYTAGSMPAAGTYYFAFADLNTGHIVSPLQEITLENAPSEVAKISASEPMLRSRGTVVNANETVTFLSTISCSSGYFADDVTLAIFNSDGGTSIDAIASPSIFIGQGEETVVSFTDELTMCTPGHSYLAAVFNGYSQISPMFEFYVDTTTGVENINAPTHPTKLYNLQGVPVDPDSAAPGIYISINGNTATKILIK